MRFSRDRRGQSVVIGTVVLFGFLIVALSLYQIQVVPQQSGQAEFEHFEDVQNDLVELRTAVSAAGQSERPQFVDVKLGTSYQTRVLAINPPDPAGTLRTSDAYNITITDDSGTTVNVSTRFIEYRPRYNEIESGSTWYDNSVLYLEETDSNRPAVIVEEQNILVDNDTLRLTAVQNEFSASGTRTVAVELYPTTDATDLSNLSGGLDVRIPTRLGSEDGYWNESIENGSVTYQGVDDTAYPDSSEVSALTLRVDSPDNVSVNSVGVQAEPAGETAKDNVGPGDGGGGDGSTGSGLADGVELVESDTQVNNGDLVVRFRNDNTQSVTFDRARLVEYDESSAPGNRDPIDTVEYEYGNVELVEGDPLEDVTGPTVSNGANVDVTFSPVATDASGNSETNAEVESGDRIEFTVEFSDQSQRTYEYTVP